MIKAAIIDDEPAVARIITHFIDMKKMPVDIIGIAEDGQSGIDLITDKKPDIVFLDIQMPKRNGFEVMKNVPDMKYIVITAYESFSYAQQALRLGAYDIILKPIDDNQLVKAIERAIDWNITDNTTVNKMLEYFHNNYAEDIDLIQLAEKFYLTPSHLSRLFKKHTGITIVSYIHKIRIEKAAELLDYNKYSVKEVANYTGYNSLNNFYKYFNHFMEMTPGEYCKNKKNSE